MKISLFRYAAIYAVTVAALAVLNVVLTRLLGRGLPVGAASIIPPMLGAMMVGQHYARATRAALPAPLAWRAALAMTFVAAAINLALMALVLATPTGAILRRMDPTLMLALTGVLLAVTLFLNRHFLGLGAKSELKSIARRERGE